MLKERVLPFCRADAADQEKGAVRGDGANFVYTAVEIAALQSRCAALMPALTETM
jgi:hypothetical protein